MAACKNTYEAQIEVENRDSLCQLTYYINKGNVQNMWVRDTQGLNTIVSLKDFTDKYPFMGLFSDVDINFHSNPIANVTSLSLDMTTNSRRSDSNLTQQINQLIVDIQAMDDSTVAREALAAEKRGETFSSANCQLRMRRFTSAYSRMFEKLEYSCIENRNGKKAILFSKGGHQIPIESLSSGEKQIVYRGCFLLKDANAMNGAFVFIDEPEISLHPNWQKKIMDYYKGIFTDSNGVQTSQIFAVTHSPFVIHNENRRNDKVIVLDRDVDGHIIVKDKPEYYACTSTIAVQDAFAIHEFDAGQPTVYLEGQTDEKYFKKAVEVFGFSVPFRFKWVGYIDSNKQETNTGEKSVDKAFHFLVAEKLPVVNICLKDCDTNRQPKRIGNVIATSIPSYNSTANMTRGIENALVLDGVDLTPYYSTKEKTGYYGEKTSFQEFDKMACCNAICAMDNTTLTTVFQNLKDIITDLLKLYNGENI